MELDTANLAGPERGKLKKITRYGNTLLDPNLIVNVQGKHAINNKKLGIDLIKKGLKINIKSVLTDLDARNLFLDYEMPYGELKTF